MILEDLFGLAGRVALITGGGRGIGRMIAEGYVAAGANVIIASRNPDAEAAAEMGPRCTALAADLASVEGCRALAEQVAARSDRLDILVNNAGVAWGAPFEEFPEDGWDKVMNLNVRTPFFLTQALHPLLKRAATADRPAKVINIVSVDGQRINAWETYSYQASKAALTHLTRRMAARLITDHIVVSGLAPGAFASRMNKAARDRGDTVASGIPAGRIGRDEDMAAAALYLAARSGDYVVGETLTVDGGLVNATTHDIDG